MDRADLVLALAVAAGAAWLLMRYFSPYPHPLAAQFLAHCEGCASPRFWLLAGAGLMTALASLLYLAFRYLRPFRAGDPPRAEVVSRLLAAASVFAIVFWPPLYRLGMVFNLEFAVLFVALVGFLCWYGGRWGRNNLQYTLGVFLLSSVAALDLRALALLVVEMACDAYVRRQSSLEERFDDENASAAPERMRELICSLFAMAAGLPLSVFARLRFSELLPPIKSYAFSPLTLTIAIVAVLYLAALKVYRSHRRRYGSRLSAASLLALLCLLLLDAGLVVRLEKLAPERTMLARLAQGGSPEEFLGDCTAYREAKRKWDFMFETGGDALEYACDRELWRMAREAEAQGKGDLALTLDRANRALQAHGVSVFEEK